MDSNKPVLKRLFKSGYMPRLSIQHGFTLIELLVTVSIAGILIGIAVPSFKAIIRNSRLTTYTNEFITSLNLARSEAIKRGVPVTVRKVDNNSKTKLAADAEWEDGWDIFTDSDLDGVAGKFDGKDVLIKSNVAFNATYTLRGRGVVANYIRFGAFGQPVNGDILILCDNSDGNAIPEADTAKLIDISNTGRPRIMADNNTPKDGIPNLLLSGANIQTCNP